MKIDKLYLNESETSYRYGYSRSWFQRERWKGTGPKFLKISSKVLYPLEDTDKWFSAIRLREINSKAITENDT